MTPEDQLRERIAAALQSRHGTNAVRITTDNDPLKTVGLPSGASTMPRTYTTLSRAMLELDGINPKVADDLRDRMDTIWHALTESERALIDARTEGAWSACAVVGLDHDRTTVSHRENELDALVSLAIALGLDADGGDPLDERDAALAEIGRLRAHIADASAIADRLIHEERCEWSGEPGREANCDCGVNTLRAMLASPGARVPQWNDEER
jgi:hypothetical protein